MIILEIRDKIFTPLVHYGVYYNGMLLHLTRLNRCVMKEPIKEYFNRHPNMIIYKQHEFESLCNIDDMFEATKNLKYNYFFCNCEDYVNIYIRKKVFFKAKRFFILFCIITFGVGYFFVNKYYNKQHQ